MVYGTNPPGHAPRRRREYQLLAGFLAVLLLGVFQEWGLREFTILLVLFVALFLTVVLEDLRQRLEAVEAALDDLAAAVRAGCPPARPDSGRRLEGE